jgi:hypothetical protein
VFCLSLAALNSVFLKYQHARAQYVDFVLVYKITPRAIISVLFHADVKPGLLR